MNPEVLTCLRCPICAQDLTTAGNAVRCPTGHSFDLARQGYLNLLAGRGRTDTADTAAMVAARAEFLLGGHYAPLAARLAELATEAQPADALVLDAGASVGYYLGAVLDRLPGSNGLALDLSALALRRAARANPRIGAVVWDIWRPWPVRDGCASLVLNVFAPRNGAEFRRVLRADGTLLVVTPGPEHLAELGSRLGMIAVDPDKDRRLAASLSEHVELAGRETLTVPLTLSANATEQLVKMGPSAHHLPADQGRATFDAIDEPLTATGAFVLSVYRPR
ncbi:MAG TPA: rRNA (guanine-N1)-methyltransferase [Pseudonocardiaceae bacterium]|jgi:23S rRNA (guanine745-N1)-methyltransferase|nr:rRNA (guanine-N1)-methyltransferase [Pseudonocardiaceae bacterium]